MRAESRNLLKGLAFLSPWIVGFCAFTLLPFGLSLYYSLCEYSLLQSPVFIGLSNYRGILHDSVFWKATWNTTYYAVLALPAALGLALVFSLLLNAQDSGTDDLSDADLSTVARAGGGVGDDLAHPPEHQARAS